jgi:sarcosine oxidase subunit alpha
MRIALDGQVIEAQEGDTVAAALLRARVTTFTRSIKYHRPRGPFCLQGSCGQCLMRVDGVPSLPACRVRAQEGMVCERQNAPLGFVEADIFRAADFLFPEGLDHHHLLTGSRILGRVALEVARRLAGLGELPSKARAVVQGEVRSAPLVVIGAGPAGLSAALEAARAGVRVLLVERDARPGGAALLLNVVVPVQIEDWVAQQARGLTAGGGELLLDSECVGLYPNDTPQPGHAMVVVRRAGALLVVVAEKVVVATGGASQPLPFPGVDRPGVYAARGLLALCAQRVRVGEKLIVIGAGGELLHTAVALASGGYEVLRSVPHTARLRAMGNPVRALEIEGERVRTDALAIAMPPAPLHGLATSVGAVARFDGYGFPVETDGEGRTNVPWLFAAGTVAGKPSIESGKAAGKAACR